jgi:diphthine synthase
MGDLAFIGMGLFDENDLTLRGLELIKRSEQVFMESYTSRLMGSSLKRLRQLTGKDIVLLDREEVEQTGRILAAASEAETLVSFLVVGDPMTATTHSSLFQEAREKGLRTIIVPNASIYSAAPSLAGLQHYKFGRTTTLAEPEGSYFPKSPYQIIAENLERGCHTLVLLDIKIDQKANLNFLMSPQRAISLLKRMEREEGKGIFTDQTRLVVVGNAGSPSPVVLPARFGEFDSLGRPEEEGDQLSFPEGIYCLIIPGALHFLEEEMLELHRPGN